MRILRLCGSEYHPAGVGIDVDWLSADELHRGQGLESTVLEFVKELASKHGLVLATFALEQAEQSRFLEAGFVECDRRAYGMSLSQFEWPGC